MARRYRRSESSEGSTVRSSSGPFSAAGASGVGSPALSSTSMP